MELYLVPIQAPFPMHHTITSPLQTSNLEQKNSRDQKDCAEKQKKSDTPVRGIEPRSPRISMMKTRYANRYTTQDVT